MLTLKLKYKCLETGYYDILKTYMSQYSICLHYLYNRISDNNNLSEKDLRALCSNINNIEYLDSWFKQSCVKESIALYKSFQTRYKEHEESREQKLKELDFKPVAAPDKNSRLTFEYEETETQIFKKFVWVERK